MKHVILIMFTAQLFISCNNKKEGNHAEETTLNQTEKNKTIESNKFDINTITISAVDIGNFPFFTLPQGLKNQNPPLEKNFDVCFFPINGVMTPIEGKLYKTNVVGDANQEFSQRYFEKSLEDYLTSVGGVKIFDGTIDQEEYNRYSKQDPNKGDEGDIGYPNQQTKVYVIRTKDKGNIYIQFTGDNAMGKLNILQETALQQSITKITSEEIKNDLLTKGKSVLQINFDIDKSSLTSKGIESVQEIIKVLKSNPELKIAINGYTDNSGTKEHNQKLSEERAATIKNEIIKSGVGAARLKSKGFGQENPIANNETEEGKAQNRRVELIKL